MRLVAILLNAVAVVGQITTGDDEHFGAPAAPGAPAAVKALLIGSHDPRGKVLRANNLTRPGVSWGGDGPAFMYEQTYADLGSYRLPGTRGLCITKGQFCEGNQILGGAAWPLPLLPNRRYIFAATVRAEFSRTLTEIDVHMIMYDQDQQLMNYYQAEVYRLNYSAITTFFY